MNLFADRKAWLASAVVLCTVATGLPVSAQDQTRNPVASAAQVQAGTAESTPKDPLPPAFGAFGLNSQDYWVSATQFAPRDAIIWTYQSFLYFATATSAQYEAQILLPAGARVTTLECFFFDNQAADASVGMWRQSYNYVTDSPVNSNVTTVASSGATGYQKPFQNINEVIKYRDGDLRNVYTLIANMPSSTNVRLKGCRLFWERTVSPGPAVATFGDVGTGNPIFAFVEALAASGITGGCGGGNYCPNQAVTRGQMAVFLSAALGLHWPY
jgi:hypothetical protein